MDQLKFNIDLKELIEFLSNNYENNFNVNIVGTNDYKYSVKKSYNSRDNRSFEIQNISFDGLNKKIIFFPIIKYETTFKGITNLPKYDYVFVFLYIIDDNSIALFSNNILKYISESDRFDSKNNEFQINNSDFEKLLSSFYLFKKQEDNTYKWQNILNYFSTFFSIALKEDNYKNLIYKIKGDSVALVRSRIMQEKTIKTIIINKEQSKSFINAMFYANLLKNLTFKIENNLIDLNGKGSGSFNISSTRNDQKYFEKINKILKTIDAADSDNKNDLPVFFLEGDIGKDNDQELEKYIFIDLFPKVFKNDNKGNIYVLDFKSINDEIDLKNENINLKDFFSNNKNIQSYFLEIKKHVKTIYKYELLENNDNNNDSLTPPKTIDDNDLFILFSKIEGNELFLGKIKEICNNFDLKVKDKNFKNIANCYEEKEKIKHWLNNNINNDYKSGDIVIDRSFVFQEKDIHCKKCEEKNRVYYIEAYKLYDSIGKYQLDQENAVFVKKDERNGEINYILKSKEAEESEKNKEFNSFSFNKENTSPSKKIVKVKFLITPKASNNKDEGLKYFFNGASIDEEDMISLGLISQLNNGKIYVSNKKADKGELADIIGYKEDGNLSIIHLIHIKKGPFITNGRQDSYGSYTTAIGQMLQKIEPILMNSIEKFFKIKVNIDDVKSKIGHKIDKTDYCMNNCVFNDIFHEYDVEEDFLKKINASTRIELRIGIAILKDQIDGDINNNTFYMVEKILLKGFEHTIKPFLNKKIEIIFYPIIIES